MSEMNGDDQAILPFDDGSAGRLIRRVWHEGRWYFSVVVVIAVLTDSERPWKYWSDLKSKMLGEGFTELSAKIGQLKMRSPLDGKMYKTDAADTETMLRIVQSVPSPKAELIKQWLAYEGALCPFDFGVPSIERTRDGREVADGSIAQRC